MVKYSKIFKYIIGVLVVVHLGYFKMIDFGPDLTSVRIVRLFFCLIGIALAFYVQHISSKNRELAKETRFLSWYLWMYIPCVLFVALSSYRRYGYNIKQLLTVIAPYFFIFYAYPLIYIFHFDRGEKKYLTVICRFVLGIVCVKAVIFFLYNFMHITLFPRILFQYPEWVRNGMQRIDGGYLFGFTLCYFIYNSFYGKRKMNAMIISAFMLLFVAGVIQFRFQVISALLLWMIMFFFSGKMHRGKNKYFFVLFLVLIVVAASGIIEKLLASFSTTGAYGASTLARLDTLLYYWNMVSRKKMIWGIGFLDTSNAVVQSMTVKKGSARYWLEDLGIIGGFFRFGILGVFVYLVPFIRVFVICWKRIKYIGRDDPRWLFFIGISAYMVISCMALNIFDAQRALLDVPFYFATLSYMYAQLSSDEKEKKRKKRTNFSPFI